MSGPWFVVNSADAPLTWSADYAAQGTWYREMTAADLGLPLQWSADHLGEAYWDFVFGRRKAPEAPYAFWLGAVDPDSLDDFKAAC